MESKVAAGKKGSGAINNITKPSQICTSSRLLFLVVVTILFCFLYFDIVQFTPSDGVLLNISPLRMLSHRTAEFLIPGDHQDHHSLLSPSSTIPFISPSNPGAHQDYHSFHSNFRPPSSTITVITSSPNPTDHQDHHSSHSHLLPRPPTNDKLLDQLPSQNPISPTTSQDNINPLFDSTIPDKQSAQLSPSTSINTNFPPYLTPPEGATENLIVSPILPPGVPKVGEINEEDEHDEVGDTIFERPAGKKKPGECNLYEGRWVKDESYPLFRSQSCPFIDDGFRCQENGRPDHDYLKWRWQPSGCKLPRFNGIDLLNRLRGSRLVFVGDSIGRNQWESMLCMLFEAVKSKTRVYEINGEPITKHKGFLIFRFEAYNCSVEYYRSPFLVPQGRPPPNPPKRIKSTLKVDTMDWTSKRWRGANIIVFNAGHWWSTEKTLRGGCYFQVGKHVNMSMGVREAFGRAMRTWRRWVTANIDPVNTQVFFRTYAPVHFSGGTWKTGGECHMERKPYQEGSKFGGESWTNGAIISETAKLPYVNLLDVTHLSNYRKDAHVSIYHVGPGDERPFKHQDCSHWCLPGLPDTWNELLYASLLQAGKGAWHSQPFPSQ